MLLSDSIPKVGVEIRFTQAARPHRIGRASVRWVLAHTRPTEVTTNHGSPAWRWSGPEERGRKLEVIAVEVHGTRDLGPVLLVIHAMPTDFTKESP
jgi:hypothetical protein